MWDLLVLMVSLVLKDHLESPDKRVMLVLLALKGWLALLGHRVKLVLLDQRVVEEHRGHLVQPGFLDLLEGLAHLVRRVLLVNQVLLVFLEKRVHMGFEETMDLQDAKEKEAPLGLLEALETKEILEKMDHQDLTVHRVLQEQQGKEEL